MHGTHPPPKTALNPKPPPRSGFPVFPAALRPFKCRGRAASEATLQSDWIRFLVKEVKGILSLDRCGAFHA